jgi:hypothetical protein
MALSKIGRGITPLSVAFMLISLAPYHISRASAQSGRFHLEEATIADVHRAIRARQITTTQLVQLYLRRIEAYNGVCGPARNFPIRICCRKKARSNPISI